MAEKPREMNRMLRSMVALNVPSLPVVQAVLETLASLSGTSVDPQDHRGQGKQSGVPVGRQHGRRGPRAGADSLVESGRSLRNGLVVAGGRRKNAGPQQPFAGGAGGRRRRCRAAIACPDPSHRGRRGPRRRRRHLLGRRRARSRSAGLPGGSPQRLGGESAPAPLDRLPHRNQRRRHAAAVHDRNEGLRQDGNRDSPQPARSARNSSTSLARLPITSFLAARRFATATPSAAARTRKSPPRMRLRCGTAR